MSENRTGPDLCSHGLLWLWPQCYPHVFKLWRLLIADFESLTHYRQQFLLLVSGWLFCYWARKQSCYATSQSRWEIPLKMQRTSACIGNEQGGGDREVVKAGAKEFSCSLQYWFIFCITLSFINVQSSCSQEKEKKGEYCILWYSAGV